MKRNKTPLYRYFVNNKYFLAMSIVYLLVLTLLSGIACYFSYEQRKDVLLGEIDYTATRLTDEYEDIVDNFWQLYMPVFESRDDIFVSLHEYFAASGADELTPFQKNNLQNALKQMIVRDNRVLWICLYNPRLETNYMLWGASGNLIPVDSEFPYLVDLATTSKKIRVFGLHTDTYNGAQYENFAVCGGVPFQMGEGQIVAGYSVSSMNKYALSSTFPIGSLSYILTNNGQTIYRSGFDYLQSVALPAEGNFSGVVQNADGQKIVLEAKRAGAQTVVSYFYSADEAFRYAHGNTPSIILIVIGCALISSLLYMFVIKQISRDVDTIRGGLYEIGENNLAYRIPDFRGDVSMSEIAASINQMAQRLNENINRSYQLQLKQKEAELSELQSKFHPHFLYNTLEMIRSRCYQNGDSATAELIYQLASIFRGFISSKTLIPLQEEMAFSRRYMALFTARFDDRLEILYDIDTELLQFSVIRNTFQPLIENYFVHGFESATAGENYIRFIGKSIDEATMLLTIEDNGAGISDEKLDELNQSFEQPITVDTGSYGLKNLNQRLKLFYGQDCGLSVEHNVPKGIRIHIKVRKMRETG